MTIKKVWQTQEWPDGCTRVTVPYDDNWIAGARNHFLLQVNSAVIFYRQCMQLLSKSDTAHVSLYTPVSRPGDRVQLSLHCQSKFAFPCWVHVQPQASTDQLNTVNLQGAHMQHTQCVPWFSGGSRAVLMNLKTQQ